MSDTIQQQFQEEIENGEVIEMETEIRSPVAAKYNLSDAVITEMKQRFLVLTIGGVNDKAGYLAVQEAERKTRETRLSVEKTRKGLKEGLLAEGRIIDGEARRLTAELEPIEAHLKNQMRSIDAEKERAKAEAQRKLDERNQGRMDALVAAGKTDMRLADVVNMDDRVFTDYLKMALESQARAKQAEIDAEFVRKAEEEKRAQEAAQKAKEEEARQAAIRESNRKEADRLAAAKAEQDKRDAEFRAERLAFEKQKAEADRIAREDQIRKDAEAKAKADAETKETEKKARELIEIARALEIEVAMELSRKAKAEEEAEAKAAEQAKAAAIEAAKPDAEKLIAFAQTIEALALPSVASESGILMLPEISNARDRFSVYVRNRAKALTEIK